MRPPPRPPGPGPGFAGTGTPALIDFAGSAGISPPTRSRGGFRSHDLWPESQRPAEQRFLQHRRRPQPPPRRRDGEAPSTTSGLIRVPRERRRLAPQLPEIEREADLSTEQAGAEASPRLSCPHGHQERPQGDRPAPRPRPQAAVRLRLAPTLQPRIPSCDGSTSKTRRFSRRTAWRACARPQLCATEPQPRRRRRPAAGPNRYQEGRHRGRAEPYPTPSARDGAPGGGSNPARVRLCRRGSARRHQRSVRGAGPRVRADAQPRPRWRPPEPSRYGDASAYRRRSR